MKKTTIVFLALLMIISLPAALFAAKKPKAVYVWDRNINVIMGSDEVVPKDPEDPNFPEIVPHDEEDPLITVDPETGTISFEPLNDGSGVIWYGGTTKGCNPCNSGVCTFGLGLRAYFKFKFDTPDASSRSTDYGDGFTFFIANASNNDKTKRGGAPNDSFTMGELLGYAGPGNTHEDSTEPLAAIPLDGLGIEPPKIGIEFDTFPNDTSMSYEGCSGGRNDYNDNNHVALMFWGENPGSDEMCSRYSTAGRYFPRASFDDNVHGAGSGTTSSPYNSAGSGNGSGLGGYYSRTKSTYNWLEDGDWHNVRIEVIRTPSTNTYQVKAWVDCETYSSPYNACPATEYQYFENLFNPYDNSSYPPKINRTQQLSASFDSMLDNIIFGFSVATGQSLQGVKIKNFAFYFPTTLIEPTGRSHTYSSASGQTINVSAASSTCAWTAISNNSWITITNGASGTGNGSVTYSIAANNGAQRTGTITIGRQSFTVTQAPYVCAGYTLNPTSRSHPGSAASNQTISIIAASSTCAWTAVSNDDWITITGGTSGTGNGTVTYSITANNTGAQRTGTITIGDHLSFTVFTVTQSAACSGYTVYNNTGQRRYFRISGSSCSRVSNNSAIPGTLTSGGTVTRYGNSDRSCVWGQGSAGYTDAVTADSNGNCVVNYNSNDTLGDR